MLSLLLCYFVILPLLVQNALRGSVLSFASISLTSPTGGPNEQYGVILSVNVGIAGIPASSNGELRRE